MKIARMALVGLGVLVLSVLTTHSAQAGTLTFDSLSCSPTGSAIPGGYGGLNWSNMYCVPAASNAYNPSGYSNGIGNVAFNGGGGVAFSSSTPFNLSTLELGAAWNNGLAVVITGYNGTKQLYQDTFTVSTSGLNLETLNFYGVTLVTFSSSGGTSEGFASTGLGPGGVFGTGTEFVLDDMTVPEPSVIVLLGSLLLLLTLGIPFASRLRAATTT